MPQPPDKLAHELRTAVLGSDHEKAARLTQEYVAALHEHWTKLSVQERAVSAVPKQSLELLAWVREMTLMQRAMTGEHLKMLAKAMRYQTARTLYAQSAALAAR